MSSREFKRSTIYAMSVGSALLLIGSYIFGSSGNGTVQEKIGMIILTGSAIFIGMAYTAYVARRTR
ncbi:MAG: hypothetical protein E6L05_00555 [Thaumarchaeota archaeon]|nr:MAG: hypothetical protein E6L05_00555 [Nitrososphaerota archaeon]